MERYTDEQMAQEMGWKLGNVRYVKRQMRRLGLLDNHSSLNETHFSLYQDIEEFKEERSATWEEATAVVLARRHPPIDDLENALELVKNGQADPMTLLVPMAQFLLDQKRRKK